MQKNQMIQIHKGNMSDEDLEKINSFAKAALNPDDIYVFSVLLCDNEIDRDYEQFSVASLNALAKLFIGKTGITDHDPKAANQVARVFETSVEMVEGTKNKIGEDYFKLTAKAYMLRLEANKDFIAEIEAGIKKEVSIGCAIKSSACSICGNIATPKTCQHIRGKTYDGKLCFRILNDPVDAYEFSFVAVPAQPAAGVTKAFMLNEKDLEAVADILFAKLEKRIEQKEKKAEELINFNKKSAGKNADAILNFLTQLSGGM